jgi:hypothetical protein
MYSQDQLSGVVGATAYDRNGDKIGKVGAVYYDDATDQPTWLTVNTGFFGTRETFVPIQGAEISDGRATLDYDKPKVKGAPRIAEDGHLSPEEEQQLYRYYGIEYGADPQFATGRQVGRDRDSDSAGVYDDVAGRAVGRDTSGPTTDEAMTRSEERLKVGTESREVGRARLRKHVVTENQQVTVPVSREQVTFDR